MKHLFRCLFLCLLAATLSTACDKKETVIGSASDIQDKKIGVMTGSIGESLAKEKFPKASVQCFDDIMDAVTAIKSGQLDAIITAYPTALQVVKKNTELRILPEPLDNEDTAVAIKKENEQLLEDVNRIIGELQADGTLDDMKKRWLKADLSPYEEREIPLPQTGDPIKIGVSATREPLSFVDANGKVSGYDGELARRIASRLKRPIEFSNMKFMALIPALQSGKIDMVISGMNATAERRKAINFSLTYFANSQVILAKKPGGERATSPTANADALPENLKPFATKKIGVMTGSTGEATAEKRFPKAEIKRFDDLTDIVVATRSGQIDAAVIAQSSATPAIRAHTDLRALPDPLFTEHLAIAIKKSNPALLHAVNQTLAEFQQDGTLAAMRSRWIKSDNSPYQTENIPAISRGDMLRIGVSATLEPLAFMDGAGNVMGHDVELAQRIALKLKRPIAFIDMKFMALIPALQSGKIDMILTGMTATDERRKSVDFSAPYLNDAQIMLVKSASPPADASQSATSQPRSLTLQQLEGKRIGVLTGSAGDLAARKRFPKAQILDMNAAADAALAIKTNKADAFVYDKSVLLNLAEKNPELVILDEPVAKLEVAAALKKDNTALLKDMNAVLGSLKKDGTLARLRQKWIDSKDSAARQLPPESSAPTNGTLRMGTYAIIEPFAYQANGKMTGLDIELGQLIAARLGKRLEIIDMQFEALIPALQSGKIDFAMSNFNVTEERKKLVNFALPYVENDISALVRRNDAGNATTAASSAPPNGAANPPAGSGNKIASADDIKDKRIGVLLGSDHDRYAMRAFPSATVLQYKSPPDIVLAVKSGKVDAGLYARETLADVLRNDPELGQVGDSLYVVPIAMGFKKGNDDIRKQFNAFLKQIKTNGVHTEMVERWIIKGGTTMPDIPQVRPDRKGTLTVAIVSDKGMPFTMMKDNQLIGFDVELVQRFGAFLGKDVKFADMEFGSLIAAVSTGKVDMVTSTLMVTEERKKQIDFSDVYYEMGTSVFALKKNIASHASGNTPPSQPSFLQSVRNSFHSNIVLEKRYLLIWDGLKVTFLIAVLSSIFGTLLGALVCFMRMSKRAALYLPAKAYIAVLRGTPVLVLLMLIFYVAFASININPVLVAVIAFGMNFAAYAAEIFRAGIEGVDKGQTEAGIAMGFTKLKTFLYIVLPQAVRQILPVYKGEFISLVKMTSIVGYIAVQDLTKASDIIRSRTFDAFFPLVMVAILYFLMAWLLTQSLEYLERATDPKRKRNLRSKA